MDRTMQSPKLFNPIHLQWAFVLTLLTELALAFIFTFTSGLPFFVVFGYLNKAVLYHVLTTCLFGFYWLIMFTCHTLT